MSGDTTIEAVRLALGLQELQARVAGTNIANAGRPDAQALRIEFADAQAALQGAAEGAGGELVAGHLHALEASLGERTAVPSAEPINLDVQVAEMVSAGTNYQVLSEALSRQFGLMRLAIGGRN